MPKPFKQFMILNLNRMMKIIRITHYRKLSMIASTILHNIKKAYKITYLVVVQIIHSTISIIQAKLKDMIHAKIMWTFYLLMV